jgi:hypothetical protein
MVLGSGDGGSKGQGPFWCSVGGGGSFVASVLCGGFLSGVWGRPAALGVGGGGGDPDASSADLFLSVGAVRALNGR